MTLVWLQREVRLDYFPALQEALKLAKQKSPAEPVILVYFHDANKAVGEANTAWLAYSLKLLQEKLSQMGASLWILEGSFEANLLNLIEQYKVQRIFYTYQVGEPFVSLQNLALNLAIEKRLELRPFYSEFLVEPAKVRNKQNKPYLVFTPFYKNLLANQSLIEPLTKGLDRVELTSLAKPQDKSWLNLPPSLHKILQESWAQKLVDKNLSYLGEDSAWDKLIEFYSQNLSNYAESRDHPYPDSTSLISPNLHFGELNIRGVYLDLEARVAAGEVEHQSAAPWLRQLAWREFARHLLVNFPQTEFQPFQQKYNQMSWSKKPQYLAAWQQGKTGIPIVDAGMRQLWQTGRMHNRVRMLVASFLTKNLNQSWLLGKDWFDNTLLDADPANNTMGWQWVAGCGVDAAPYYRLFNPVVQSLKFDQEGKYIKQWVPELASLSAKAVHAPWENIQECELKGIVLGKTYPRPLVDLKESRLAHLARVEELKLLP